LLEFDQRVWRVADENKTYGRIAVKPKSADKYIGRPNEIKNLKYDIWSQL